MPTAVTYFPNGVNTGVPVVASADVAITLRAGTVHITKGSAAALTLSAPIAGAPSAGGEDGNFLRIYSETAFAHTVTQTTPGFNNGGAASDVGTFAAAVGNGLDLEARNGIWWVIRNAGVTLA